MDGFKLPGKRDGRNMADHHASREDEAMLCALEEPRYEWVGTNGPFDAAILSASAHAHAVADTQFRLPEDVVFASARCNFLPLFFLL